MLRLENITKNYVLGNARTKKNREKMRVIRALKGLNLEFRESEFVAILGPSGCGKTTLLNIVGGLDKYTSGDLIINGKSTKDFKDYEWDSYRNHSVGFVFQSYNLIPHQSVLNNVVLALTMSGMSKEESKERAMDALRRVGLGTEYDKKPNQLSGGQMQRVAIARAIVNNPDILLADEPTGALDSETSVQVMDILQELSKEKLVIMVTHNAEIAETYATRTISLKDGHITGDTAPYQTKAFTENTNPWILPVVEDDAIAIEIQKDADANDKTKLTWSTLEGEKSADDASDAVAADEQPVEQKKSMTRHQLQKLQLSLERSRRRKLENSSLSRKNALKLSYTNLISKKGRTLLTSLAGSVGIIGITLVLALSTGFENYIARTEEDSLSRYPLEISTEESSLSGSLMSLVSILTGSGETDGPRYEGNDIGVKTVLGNMLDQFMGADTHANDLNAFLKYLEKNFDYSNGFFKYNFGEIVKLLTYTNYANVGTSDAYFLVNPFADAADDLIASLPSWIQAVITGEDAAIDVKSFFSSIPTWDEIVDNQAMLDNQYDLVDGHWPTSKEEVVLVLEDGQVLSDYLLFVLGIKAPSEVLSALGGGFDEVYKSTEFIDNLEYKLLRRADYVVQKEDGTWVDLYEYRASDLSKTGDYAAMINSLLEDPDVGLTLKVSGIVVPKPGAAGSITGVIGYSKLLTDWLINSVRPESAGDGDLPAFVDAQFKSTDIELLTNNKFDATDNLVEYMGEFGYIEDTETPKKILLYANSFEGKERIIEMIEQYNRKNPESTIQYSDSLAILMSSITTILTSITYILIGFSAISLIVSSIMIAIIIYTSVLERTKEIGVLRSIGARKKDIARVFNSESMLIGLTSGAIGVLFTFIAQYPISAILNKFLGIPNLMSMHWAHAIVMLALSVGLSLIAGVIPSQVAANKDPVTALRSE